MSGNCRPKLGINLIFPTSTDQLAFMWMNTSHTNRVFKGRYINRVSKTRFLGGRHV